MIAFKEKTQHIIFENEKIFRGHESMSKQRDTHIYLFHLYQSWERERERE